MRKVIVIAIVAAFLQLLIADPVYSQDVSYDQRYREYQNSLDQYRKKHEEYVLARSQYLKFNTLQSKNEAHSATLNMLQARDDVVITYLESLKARMLEVGGLDEDTRSGVVFEIDQEISWFKEHKAALPTAGTLEDLAADSSKAAARHEEAQDLFYRVLSYIPKGRISILKDKLVRLHKRISDKVSIIKSEERAEYQFGSEKLAVIDEWLFESESSIIRSEAKLKDAQELVDQIGEGNKKGEKVYGEVVDELRNSLQYVKQGQAFTLEVIKEIKRER